LPTLFDLIPELNVYTCNFNLSNNSEPKSCMFFFFVNICSNILYFIVSLMDIIFYCNITLGKVLNFFILISVKDVSIEDCENK
jgi:hypothetical protein